MRRLGSGLLLLACFLPLAVGQAGEPLEPDLASTDAVRRVRSMKRYLAQADAAAAFSRLLELAREHGGKGLGRGALEGLCRLRAPRMVTKLESANPGGYGPEEKAEAFLRGFTGHPLRVLPSVRETLDATYPGSGRYEYADEFVALATITQKVGIAFVLDAENREVIACTPAEALAHHAAWLAGPGPEALAWADFLRAQQGVIHDRLDAGMIDVRMAQLLSDEPAARRRAAYVLGRCLTAEGRLREALSGSTAAQRAVVEEVLARHELRAYGDVVLVSSRGGSPDLWRMRLDGGALERLTREDVDTYIPDPSPDGRRVAYHHDHGERGRRFAVLDLVTRETWRPPAGDASVGCWSPDGRFLAYMVGPYQDRSLRLLDTQTGKDRELGAVGTGGMGYVSLPTWSPDGSTMVYVAYGQLLAQGLAEKEPRVLASGSYRQPEYVGEDLLVIQTEEGRDSLVRRTAGGERTAYARPEEGQILRVVLSPDRARAVFATKHRDPRVRTPPGVYFLDLSGSGSVRRVGEGMFPRPLWAPKGDKVALDCAYQTLVVLDADGERLCEPERNLMAGGAVWGPEGEVLYASEMLPLEQGVTPDRLRTRFRLARWRDGAWERLRELEGWLGLQRVTPDGRWLILATDHSGDRELIAASTDGRYWLNLTEHPAEDHAARPLPRAR